MTTERTFAGPAAPVDHVRRGPAWGVLAICATAQLMVVLDVSVVYVALPSMRVSLHMGLQGQQWVVNAYTLTFAGFLLFGGRAGDYFGRKRLFITGLSVFVVASLLGGLAHDGWQLISARTLQGCGSAMLAPSTLSLLTTTYTEPKARARALGIWAAMGAAGGALGAVVGGVLTDLLSWRWVLFVNVPIGAVLITIAVVILAPARGIATRVADLDLPGAVAVTGGLALVIYAIVGTDNRSWAAADTVVPLLAGAALLGAFVAIEARAAKPLVPLGIFRLRSLASANVTAVFVGGVMFCSFFFMSLYLQQVLRHSPLRTGVEFVPGGLAIAVGSFVSTRLVGRVGPRRLLVCGAAVSAVGLVLLSRLAASGTYADVVVPLLLTTGGLGMALVPMTVAGTAGVPPHEAGLAAGLINTSRQVGGAIALAALATVASSRSTSLLAEHRSVASALTSGFDRAQLLGAGLAIAALLVALTLPRAVGPRAAAAGSAATIAATSVADENSEPLPVAIVESEPG